MLLSGHTDHLLGRHAHMSINQVWTNHEGLDSAVGGTLGRIALVRVSAQSECSAPEDACVARTGPFTLPAAQVGPEAGAAIQQASFQGDHPALKLLCSFLQQGDFAALNCLAANFLAGNVGATLEVEANNAGGVPH